MGRALPPIYRRVGLRLKAAREGREVTQEALAERCGIGTDYVGKIEAGTRRVQLETLEAVASALGVPLATLLPESISMPSGKLRGSIARDAAAELPATHAGLAREAEIQELVDGLRELDRAAVSSLSLLVRRMLTRRR